MITWGSYGKYDGPIYRGEKSYSPVNPSEWQKILVVIADCEGKFDTVVMHDGTGITAGFMQWTLTSGRLQKFLEFLKIKMYPGKFPGEKGYKSIFEVVCEDINGIGRFVPFGFDFKNGKMVDLKGNAIEKKEQIIKICRGNSKEHAEGVLMVMVEVMSGWGVPEAQEEFAEKELSESSKLNRSVLGKYKTIDNILSGSWKTPAPALFYNLYQNNLKAAFSLYMKAKEKEGDLFNAAWELLKESKFGNWSYNSVDYKKYKRKPRIERIKGSINKYYGTDLKIS